jgi:hypothetical protein
MHAGREAVDSCTNLVDRARGRLRHHALCMSLYVNRVDLLAGICTCRGYHVEGCEEATDDLRCTGRLVGSAIKLLLT